MDEIFADEKLQGYRKLLAEEGFEDLESLRLATFDDLMACGIKRGHARILHQRIQPSPPPLDPAEKQPEDAKGQDHWLQQYPTGSYVRVMTDKKRGLYLARILSYDAHKAEYKIHYVDDDFEGNTYPHLILGPQYIPGETVEHKERKCLGRIIESVDTDLKLKVFWDGQEMVSTVRQDEVHHELKRGLIVATLPTSQASIPIAGTIVDVKDGAYQIDFGSEHKMLDKIWQPRDNIYFPYRDQRICVLDKVDLLAHPQEMKKFDAEHTYDLSLFQCIDKVGTVAKIVGDKAHIFFDNDAWTFPVDALCHVDHRSATPETLAVGMMVRPLSDEKKVKVACERHENIGWCGPMSRVLGKAGLVIRLVTRETGVLGLRLLFGTLIELPVQWLRRRPPVDPKKTDDGGPKLDLDAGTLLRLLASGVLSSSST
uniref:SAM domain-containing protein n=1 Tax=viral metagenome TaxID=1070528 RepID=A0A6C0BML3_9ZZZZ